MKYIDLHTHSTASDGSMTPTELVKAAKAKGLVALALSDHDTIDGLPEAREAASEAGIELINAVELSVGTKQGSVHMLGYMFDPENEIFKQDLSFMIKRRDERNLKFIERFKEIGIEIDIDELREVAGDGAVGRPHFAKLLIGKGIVNSFDEAFDKYLAKGKAAYVPKARVSPEQGIEAIHNAGGVAVLAHPKYSGAKTKEEVEALVIRLKKAKLDGIECHYTDHTDEETAFYISLAKKYSLCITGGTDYHGEALPDKVLGELPNNRRIGYEILANLKQTHQNLYKKS